MTINYRPQGVCANSMTVTVEDGIVTDAQVIGGCHGNLQAVTRLVIGMKAEDAIAKIEGICCGRKATSCPDQLAKALRKAMQ